MFETATSPMLMPGMLTEVHQKVTFGMRVIVNLKLVLSSELMESGFLNFAFRSNPCWFMLFLAMVLLCIPKKEIGGIAPPDS